MTDPSEKYGEQITHPRTCDECGEETYQFERCHHCGDVPWKIVTDGGREQGTVSHERTVHSAYSHMDLSEHVTWMLSDAVDGVGYPQKVSVEITVEEVDR